MDFFAVSFVADMRAVEMRCFCLLPSMELFLTPICSSFLYSHSNAANSLKSSSLKKVTAVFLSLLW